MLYRIAQEIGKSVEEVMQLSVMEIQGWSQFLHIQYEEARKQANKNK